jgi:hypothetical protein
MPCQRVSQIILSFILGVAATPCGPTNLKAKDAASYEVAFPQAALGFRNFSFSPS